MKRLAGKENEKHVESDREPNDRRVGHKGTIQTVLGSENELSHDQKDRGGKQSRNDGSDDPGQSYIANSFPVHSFKSLCHHCHTDNTTDAGMGGRHRKTKQGGNDQP